MDALLDLASQIGGEEDKTISLLPHNQKLYNEIKSKVQSGERAIFFSEGTGLGKSYVFMKIVEELFPRSRVLYVVPKIAIWDNLTHYPEFRYIDNRVTMTTFAAFNKRIEEDSYFFEHDVVFVDECHHMLSDIQGKNVQQFLNDAKESGKHVFGMTATPEVNGVFVDEECFDVSCYGLDMYEAIEQGLMPKMDIAVGIREEIDIPDNLREKYSIVGTKTLLEKVLEDYSHVTHWLAYFTTKEELEQNESELRKLFPKFKVLRAYHGLDNTDVIEEFENSEESVVLMSVAMFLEGMHLKNVGGILLYRNVMLSHTYAQILGRLCVLGQKVAPVMVDIPGAILGIKNFSIPKSSKFVGERKHYSKKDIFDVTARGYKVLELAEALAALNDSRWSEEEDEIITMFYPSEGADVVKRLYGRTAWACSRRAYILGVTTHNKRAWTEQEILELKIYYPIEGGNVCKRFPYRSEKSVLRKAYSLGLRTDAQSLWTEEEDELLRVYYPNEGPECFKRITSHSPQACAGRVFRLQLKTTSYRPDWTAEEDKLVMTHYGKDNKLLADSLPNRTWAGIKMRARMLGVVGPSPKKWSDEEINILRNVYPKHGMRKVVDMLPDRTCTQIRSMAHKLQISRDRG